MSARNVRNTPVMHISANTFLLALLSLTSTADAARKPSNAILLSQVKSLTLKDGALTSSRRVSPIPQLKCVGGGGCNHYSVDVMRCKNAGSDYGPEDIQWTCTASIPEEFKLGSTDVICEGYDGPDDPYVLKGSCGVEYRLLLTDKGEEKYGSPSWGDNLYGDNGPGVAGGLFWLLFLGVLGWIGWGIYKSWRDAPPRPPGGGPGGGGGFWGGGWGGGGPGGDDPPPPYPGYPGSKPSQGQQGWQPGFWTGALGGAAAGYLAGNRGGRQEERRGLFGGGYGNGYGNGYGSGGGYGGSPFGSPRGPSRSGSGSSSGARYESTGFGSTSRR